MSTNKQASINQDEKSTLTNTEIVEFINWHKQFILNNLDQAWRSPQAVGLTLGVDEKGKPYQATLKEVAHILLGGASNDQLIELIKAWSLSLMAQSTPKQLQLAIISTSVDEFNVFKGSPHFVEDPIVDKENMQHFLEYVEHLMEERIEQMQKVGARSIDQYNEWARKHNEEEWQSLVVFMQDLEHVMSAYERADELIAKIGRRANYVGIHLVVATTSVRASVINGNLKANLPSRVSFELNNSTESSILLDGHGGERLSGDDLLVRLKGGERERIRANFVPIEYQSLLIQALNGSHNSIGKIEYTKTN